MRYLLFFILSMTIYSCGGSKNSSEPKNEPTPTSPKAKSVTGIFYDAPVVGLNYKTSSGMTGVTAKGGTFNCKEGDTVTFSIGKSEIGSTSCSQKVTPAVLTLGLTNQEAIVDILHRSISNCSTMNDNKVNCLKITGNVCSFKQTEPKGNAALGSCSLTQPLTQKEIDSLTKLDNMLSLIQSLDSGSSTTDVVLHPDDIAAFDTELEKLDGSKSGRALDFSKSSFNVKGLNLTQVVQNVNANTVSNSTLKEVTSTSARSKFLTDLKRTNLFGNFYINTNEDMDGKMSVSTFVGLETDTTGVVSVGSKSPTKGTFTCTGSDCTYKPNANAYGTDSFTIISTVKGNASAEHTVTIDIKAVNDRPTASKDVYTVSEDGGVFTLTLSGTDTENQTLGFIITSKTKHGSLSNCGGNTCEYKPDLNFNGTDSFSFKVNDGNSDSQTVTSSITVTPVNDAPYSSGETVYLKEDVSSSIKDSVDIDGDALSYTVTQNPNHGTVVCNPKCIYTPNTNYNGLDNFSFKANDGTVYSNVAVISLSIEAVNDAPVVVSNSKTVIEDSSSQSINLVYTDVDGDSLFYTQVTNPKYGVATCSGNSGCVYKPNLNFNGSDSFNFTVSDGTVSVSGTASITVTPVNDAPSASDFTQQIKMNGTAINVAFKTTDVDGDSLTPTVVTQPSNGSVSCSGNVCSYTPSASYIGTDSFTYKVNDGTIDSNTSTVTFNITDMLTANLNVINLKVGEQIDIGGGALHNKGNTNQINLNTFVTGDVSMVDSTIATIVCDPTYLHSCRFNGVKGGITSFKYSLKYLAETTSPHMVTVNVGNVPTFSQSLYNIYNAVADTVISVPSIVYSDLDAKDKYALSVKIKSISNEVFNGNIIVYKDGVPINFSASSKISNTVYSASTVFSASATYTIKTLAGFIVPSSTSQHIFDLEVKDSLGFTSSTSVRFANGVAVNNTVKSESVLRTGYLLHKGIELVAEKANPWKGLAICSNPDAVPSTYLTVFDSGTNWEPVVYSAGGSHLVFIDSLSKPGVKYIVTPYNSDGSTVAVTSSYTYDGDYAGSGLINTTNYNAMVAAARSAWNTFKLDTTPLNYVGFENGLSFQIDIVFSDADLTDVYFDGKRSLADVRTLSATNANNELKGWYYSGVMKNIANKKLLLNSVCGLINSDSNYYYSNSISKGSADTHLNWMVFGYGTPVVTLTDPAYSLFSTRSVGLAWEFNYPGNASTIFYIKKATGLHDSTTDPLKSTVFSHEYSAYDIERDVPIIAAEFSLDNDMMNSIFPNYGFESSNSIRTYSSINETATTTTTTNFFMEFIAASDTVAASLLNQAPSPTMTAGNAPSKWSPAPQFVRGDMYYNSGYDGSGHSAQFKPL